MQAIMKFESFRVMKSNYNIEIVEEVNQEELLEKSEIKVNISHSSINLENVGQLELAITVKDYDVDYNRDIEVKLQAVFIFEDIESEEQREYCETILRLNGSAILMPYVRNYISMITGFDNSTDHLLLPTFNIQALIDQEENELEES